MVKAGHLHHTIQCKPAVLCAFLLLLGKSCPIVPMALSGLSVGTHQYVSSHNAAFHSVCHLAHVPHQNNYTLYSKVNAAS